MKQVIELNHRQAMQIIESARQYLEEHEKGAAVAVVDPHGELIALLRTDGCLLPSINNAINKAFTAARQQQPSADIGKSSREDAWPLSNFGDLRYTGWGGGIPLFHDGQIIGAVGVSGLPEAEDIKIATMAASVIE